MALHPLFQIESEVRNVPFFVWEGGKPEKTAKNPASEYQERETTTKSTHNAAAVDLSYNLTGEGEMSNSTQRSKERNIGHVEKILPQIKVKSNILAQKNCPIFTPLLH